MKIAIVKLSAMGDIVHAMVALQFIKAQRPEIEIDWIVEAGFAPVLAGNPHIHSILPVHLKAIKTDKKSLLTELKNIKAYALNHYDYVIDAQGLLKSSIVARLLGKNTVGFARNSIREKIAALFYAQTVEIPYAENVIKRNLKVMCAPLGVLVSDQDVLNKQPFLAYSPHTFDVVDPHKKNVLLVLGASRPNKMYPKEKFVQIVQSLEREHQANVIAIWANEVEHEIAQYIQAHTHNCVLSNKLSLDELKALIAQVDLVIGGDTGPTHCAWALNRPSITLFGNTPEYRNTYISDINRVVKSKSTVNPLKLDKTDFSIFDIDAQEIIQLANILL